MSLKAGRLRHRVDIQSKSNVQDPVTGEITTTWVNTWTAVPASIEPLSAREFIAAQAVQSMVTARITLRYRAGLDASMRIVHKGTIYNPAGFLADPDSGIEYVTIPCSTGTNSG